MSSTTTWAGPRASSRRACAYGEEVFEVLPEKQRTRRSLAAARALARRRAGACTERLARNLVVSVGGTPNIPDGFRALRGDGRASFIRTATCGHGPPRPGPAKIAIIGAGQSAAEIFMDLQGRPHAPQVDLIMRARSIRPSDDSPFVNEVFNVEFTDYIYSQPEDERAALIDEFGHTNYAVADLDLIQQIFKMFYEQKVRGEERMRFLRRHDIRGVHATADGIHLTMSDQDSGRESTSRYDAVVLATGYAREQHKDAADAARPVPRRFFGGPPLPPRQHAGLPPRHLPAGRLRVLARPERHAAVGHLGAHGRNRQCPAQGDSGGRACGGHCCERRKQRPPRAPARCRPDTFSTSGGLACVPAEACCSPEFWAPVKLARALQKSRGEIRRGRSESSLTLRESRRIVNHWLPAQIVAGNHSQIAPMTITYCLIVMAQCVRYVALSNLNLRALRFVDIPYSNATQNPGTPMWMSAYQHVAFVRRVAAVTQRDQGRRTT
jgi:hypothetical protein